MTCRGWQPEAMPRRSSIRACFLQGQWSEGRGGAAGKLLQTNSCHVPGTGGRCPSFACCTRVCVHVLYACVHSRAADESGLSELGSRRNVRSLVKERLGTACPEL